MTGLKKIILVEDDQFDAEMTQRSLKKIPLANEIVWLETGQELIDYLDEHGTAQIAVVILDLQMPQITGLEALEIIRQKNYSYFPVVILTSSRQSPDIQASYKLGATSFVTKPVNNTEFREAIRTLGLYWGILNELPADQ